MVTLNVTIAIHAKIVQLIQYVLYEQISNLVARVNKSIS